MVTAILISAACASGVSAAPAGNDAQTLRTFVVQRHVISKDEYRRAIEGRDVRLASTGSKPRPLGHFEVRGQGDVFTGWTMGEEMPYRSGRGLSHQFVGSVGEIQPGTSPGYRTIMMKDSRLVKFMRMRDARGDVVRIPIVRSSEMTIEFPLDGSERGQVYAIPKGKKKFDYRLVTVHEDVSRRRSIVMAGPRR